MGGWSISWHRSQKLSRAQLLRFGRGDHQRHPATAPRQVAGLSSVVGRCVFGIVNRPLFIATLICVVHIRLPIGRRPPDGLPVRPRQAAADSGSGTHSHWPSRQHRGTIWASDRLMWSGHKGLCRALVCLLILTLQRILLQPRWHFQPCPVRYQLGEVTYVHSKVRCWNRCHL